MWFKDRIEIEDKAKIHNDYQHTFNRDEVTRHVLIHILHDLKFFEENIETAEDIALINAAKRILRNLGVWEEGKEVSIIQSLLGGYNGR